MYHIRLTLLGLCLPLITPLLATLEKRRPIVRSIALQSRRSTYGFNQHCKTRERTAFQLDFLSTCVATLTALFLLPFLLRNFPQLCQSVVD